jgi:hypothetical protein
VEPVAQRLGLDRRRGRRAGELHVPAGDRQRPRSAAWSACGLPRASSRAGRRRRRGPCSTSPGRWRARWRTRR